MILPLWASPGIYLTRPDPVIELIGHQLMVVNRGDAAAASS
jgi:hypothetical protein